MTPIEPVLPADLAAAHDSTAGGQSFSASTDSTRAPQRHPHTTAFSAHGLVNSTAMKKRPSLMGVARWTLGIILLLVTVFLWTASNFLASYIFSDHTYNKPFFLVYLNTSVLTFSLVPTTIRYISRHGLSGLPRVALEVWRACRYLGTPPPSKLREDNEDAAAGQRLLLVDDDDGEAGLADPIRIGEVVPATAVAATITSVAASSARNSRLTLAETARLSLEFCPLWFLANYFAAACLEHTSVGSATILTATSSVWTLVMCAAAGVESFAPRKLLAVLASLAGVALVSSVDLSGASDDTRGHFPHKTRRQIAVGDAMALLSAVIYGVYVTVMKRRVGSEERVNMPLFFGLVGLFNVVLLWPGFFILHFTGLEPFSPPPTGKVWAILVINALSSLVSDIAWAYAMLLTTPLVVTVGLSLTIPLSLIGEIFQYAQYSTFTYWVGAAVVVVSFLFLNHESRENDVDLEPETETGSRDVLSGVHV